MAVEHSTAEFYICNIYILKRRKVSPGMLCHVALVRTNVFEEHSASIIRMTRIRELGSW
jgi:hypothetical protein